MANWKVVKERWLPIVEKMEDEGMEDYAIPEIYRAAQAEIRQLREAILTALDHTWETNDD